MQEPVTTATALVLDDPTIGAVGPTVDVNGTAHVAPHAPQFVQRPFSIRELFLAVRPHQWIKNSLVLVAPIVTGAIVHPGALLAAVAAAAAFCAASAATYLVNDIADVESDKLHPTKQLRPVASGTLSVRHARIAAAAIGLLGFGLAVGLGWSFVAVFAVYLVMTTTYSMWLKHVPVVDVATVAIGFVLRVIAGAVAVGVGVSGWLLAAVWAAAVLISVGKRHAEVSRLGLDAGNHRAVLDWYRPARTATMMGVAQVGAVAAVGMWFVTTFWLTIAAVATVAVVMILERFRRLVLVGDVDDPVQVISHDRPIAMACVALGVVMVAGMLA